LLSARERGTVVIVLKRSFGLLFAATTLAFGCGDSEAVNPLAVGGGGSAPGAGGATSSSTAGHGGQATTTSTSTSSGGDGGGGGAAPGPFKVRGSVEQVDVWKATPMTAIELHDSSGATVQAATTDDLGSYVFRDVPAGDGYSVVEPTLTPPAEVSPIKVLTIDGSLPDPSFYSNQTLQAGYQYITTRDGTTLAVFITLPGDPADGPYPTVVNYSGYNPAQPGAPVPGQTGLCGLYPVLCDAPTDPSALIMALMGYATVSVNMRGTGCSGGAYDYFEEMQLLDGYDIIETVAAQPWVAHGKVGMTGLSYPGITQMFVAAQHPPHLAAISPLSVIGNTYTTARPGGIFNDGFALTWITDVLDKAAPYGQGWEQAQVDAGDTVCEENQLLHDQRVDVTQEAQDTQFYDSLAARVDPSTFVNTIDVPVFLASAFEDEQTGPFFYALLDKFTSAPVARFTTYNGVHIDGFAPQVMVEWKTFLDLYVAQTVPAVPQNIRSIAPVLFDQIFQVSMQMPPDRFATAATWQDAKTAYEAEQPLRAIFENGGDTTTTVGAPTGTFEMKFDSWPPPGQTPLTLYFHADGTLSESPATDSAAGMNFTLDPDAGHRGILADGGNVWDPLPDYNWQQPALGADVSVISDALTQDYVMYGTASADLWIRAQVNDADLEVNLMEVRPDGQEMYVQSGWLRASMRALAPDATPLLADPTYAAADAAPLVPGEWTQARVGFAAFSHVFRAGSRIRMTVDTPGGSRAAWTFQLLPFPVGTSYDIGADATHGSSLVLPVLQGVTSTTPLPPCPSLRGQQCRAYMPYANTASVNP
jgi:hypothetical protein